MLVVPGNGKVYFFICNMYLLLTYPPLHLVCSVPAWIMTCQCLRSSAISVVIWFLAMSSFTRYRHLSFGLPRFCFPSTIICSIFLVASSLSLLCTCPNHLNLFSLRNSAIGYMRASFQMSTFLTWSSLVVLLAHMQYVSVAWKARWLGHVMRVKGSLITTVLQGKVEGGMARGRQAQQWMDDVREWVGLSRNEMWREPGNRKVWKKCVSSLQQIE